MQTTEQYFLNIPSDQVEFITELMNRLKIDFRKVESLIDVNLTPEQNERLKESIRQANAGETISLEEFKERTASWFK